MDNAAKLHWIKQAGEPYPALWLKISRIADFFDYFFNLWTPRDDTGYLDANWTCESPNPPWTSHLHIVQATLAEYGFEHISDALARRDVPFITEKDYESVPEDDPRWKDDSVEPAARAATLYRCLFGI